MEEICKAYEVGSLSVYPHYLWWLFYILGGYLDLFHPQQQRKVDNECRRMSYFYKRFLWKC